MASLCKTEEAIAYREGQLMKIKEKKSQMEGNRNGRNLIWEKFVNKSFDERSENFRERVSQQIALR